MGRRRRRRSRSTSTSRSASRSARTATSWSYAGAAARGPTARVDGVRRGARTSSSTCAPTRSTRRSGPERPPLETRLPRRRDAVAAPGRRRSRGCSTAIRERFGIADGAEVTLEANPGPDERGDAGGASRRRRDPAVDRRPGDVGRRAPAARPAASGRRRGRGRRRGARGRHRVGQPRPPVRRPRTRSLADWIETLDAALALEPDHLSLYALTLDDPDAEGLTGPDGDHLPTTPGARRWRATARPRPGRGPRRGPVPPRRPSPGRRRLARLRDQQLGAARATRAATTSPTGSAGRTRPSARARTRSTARRGAGTRRGWTATSPRSRRRTADRRALPPGRLGADRSGDRGRRGGDPRPAHGSRRPAGRGARAAPRRRVRLGAGRRAARRHRRRPGRPDDARAAALRTSCSAGSSERLEPVR